MRILTSGITLSYVFTSILMIIWSIFVSTAGHAINNDNLVDRLNTDFHYTNSVVPINTETLISNRTNTLDFNTNIKKRSTNKDEDIQRRIATDMFNQDDSKIPHSRSRRIKRNVRVDSNMLKHIMKVDGLSPAELKKTLDDEYLKLTKDTKLGPPCDGSWVLFSIDCEYDKSKNSCLDLFHNIELTNKDITIEYWRNIKALSLFPKYESNKHIEVAKLTQKELLEYFLRKMLWCEHFFGVVMKDHYDEALAALLEKYKKILWSENPLTATNSDVELLSYQEKYGTT